MSEPEKIADVTTAELQLIEQGLTSPPTQYRLYGRRFFTGRNSQDPTNSIKVLKAHIDYTINRKKLQ